MRLKHCLMMLLAISAVVASAWLVLPVVTAQENATPATYIITLYKVELSSDYGATWLTVFTNAAGRSIDLRSAKGNILGQGTIPAGTYNAMRITLKNTIEYSCPPSIPSGTTFSPYPGPADAQVQVYFCARGTFSWSNDGSTLAKALPMPDPIKVKANTTSRVIINFGVTNSLVRIGGNWHPAPPTLTVAPQTPQTLSPLPNNFTGGEYYFIRQDLSLPANATPPSRPTWMEFLSGWGKFTLTPSPQNPGEGTFTVLATDYTEHRRWIRNNGLDMGGRIRTGFDGGTPEITGRYYVDADGYINISLPGSNGIIRGALRDDGKVFVAIEIASPPSPNASVGHNIIYAIKKENREAGPLIGNYVHNGYDIMVVSARDDLGTNRPEYYNLRYKLTVGYFKGEMMRGTCYETGNRVEIHRPLSLAQNVTYPNNPVRYDVSNIAAPIMVTANGTWDTSTSVPWLWGASLSDNTVSIVAGDTTDDPPQESRSWVEGSISRTITRTGVSLKFYVAVKPAARGTWNVANVDGTYSFVAKGDYWDGNNPMVLPDNRVMLGRFTLDGSGNMTGRMITVSRGQISIKEIPHLRYEVIPQWVGAAPTDPSAIEVDTIRLFHPTDPAQSPNILMLISSDGKCLVPYTPPGNPGAPASWNKERVLGLAVKQNIN